ncbi:MAG TPA: hypothetical protein VJ044_08575 [Candidatus Hodarchaeales archaeon]|nr:hypothetical protein [Candidatus Hodarchaeales archaeon]
MNPTFAEKTKLGRDYTIITWDVKPGIHAWIEENIPLELIWTASADFIAEVFKVQSVYLYSKIPNGIETLLSIGSQRFLLPFQVRGSKKILFHNVFQMLALEGNLLSPLETISELPEEYIRNAVATFSSNVVPAGGSMVASRFPELDSIISIELEKIEERFRIETRILVPVVHLATLRSDFSRTVETKYRDGQYSFIPKSTMKISAEALATTIAAKLED